MRHLPIYIFTGDLNFFYRLKRKLDEKQLKFSILSIRNKIPDIPSIVLTTEEEKNKIGTNTDNVRFLDYSEEFDFDYYILKVIIAYRIGFKENFNELMFSIDPGVKRVGMAVFLDDYYLESLCCFEPLKFLTDIRFYLDYFQDLSSNNINLSFKFGIGVPSLAFKMISNLVSFLQNKYEVKIFLIDEFKSSKIRISLKSSKAKISKDEITAIVLALRTGIPVTEENYSVILKQVPTSDLKRVENDSVKTDFINNNIDKLGEMVELILMGTSSLTEITQKISQLKSIEDKIYD